MAAALAKGAAAAAPAAPDQATDPATAQQAAGGPSAAAATTTAAAPVLSLVKATPAKVFRPPWQKSPPKPADASAAAQPGMSAALAAKSDVSFLAPHLYCLQMLSLHSTVHAVCWKIKHIARMTA